MPVEPASNTVNAGGWRVLPVLAGLACAAFLLVWYLAWLLSARSAEADPLPDYGSAFAMLLAGASLVAVMAMADAARLFRRAGQSSLSARIRVRLEATVSGVLLAGSALAFGHWALIALCTANAYVVATLVAHRR